MKVAHIAVICMVLRLSVMPLSGQKLTNYDVDTIEIAASRIGESAPFSDVARDRLGISTEATLLLNSGTYVRNYAPGQSSTMQIMGATSNQSSVLWQGIQISNPMLGISDISLLALPLFDESHILYISSLEQTAIGGQISLKNKIPDEQQFRTTYRYNSLHNHEFSGSWTEVKKKYSHKISWIGLNAQNKYKVDLGRSTYNMQYAQQNCGQVIYDGFSQANKWHIQPSVWYVQSFREIPASFGGNGNNEVQNDRQLRTQLGLERSFQRIDFHQQFAYLLDEIRFTNNFVDDLGLAHSFISQTTTKIKLSKSLSFHNWWQMKSTNGSHPNFTESAAPVTQSNLTNTLKFRYKYHKFILGGNYVYQNTFSKKHSFLPSIEWKYQSTKYNFHFQLQRALRFPTLNDLYWSPGGNSNLIPEDAWKVVSGYGIRIGLIDFRSLAYYRQTENLIQWFQQGSFWGPRNVSRVRSYGAQFTLDYNLELTKNLGLKLSQHYYYNRSINYNSNSPFFGKQLIYTPIHKITTSIGFEGLKWSWSNSGIISSARFTNQDNSQSLNSFFLWDSQFRYELSNKGNRKLLATFAIQNITNTIYQHQAGFYQPQRQMEIGLSFQL